MALDLAALRGLPVPGRREVLEACTSVFAQGDVLGRGRVVARVAKEVLIGSDRGLLAPGTPQSGLVLAFEEDLSALRLPGPDDSPRELVLAPLRANDSSSSKTLDARREVFLQRCRVARISYGTSTEVTGIGGAQAVAALAYGTASIAPVAKIVGPGNAYVAAAKRLVFGKVGIDMIAGPSEVLVIADDSGNADWIAADLLAQAEHDASAQSILITDSRRLADDVARAVEGQLKTLPRAQIAGASWADFGAIIEVEDLDQAVPLADAIAAEHLEIMTRDPDAFAARVRNAGAIFLGAHTPEAIGDYVGGSNHVLPTARSARFSSGLGVLDFMKRTSLLKCGPEQLRALGPAAMTLGKAEGLDAHSRSVGIRLNLP